VLGSHRTAHTTTTTSIHMVPKTAATGAGQHHHPRAIATGGEFTVRLYVSTVYKFRLRALVITTKPYCVTQSCNACPLFPIYLLLYPRPIERQLIKT